MFTTRARGSVRISCVCGARTQRYATKILFSALLFWWLVPRARGAGVGREHAMHSRAGGRVTTRSQITRPGVAALVADSVGAAPRGSRASVAPIA